MKPVLNAPGIDRLKLKYDRPLSKIAFNFNLRRYAVVPSQEVALLLITGAGAGAGAGAAGGVGDVAGASEGSAPLLPIHHQIMLSCALVGRFRLTVFESELKAPGFSA
jgi:hypothetical protein